MASQVGNQVNGPTGLQFFAIPQEGRGSILTNATLTSAIKELSRLPRLPGLRFTEDRIDGDLFVCTISCRNLEGYIIGSTGSLRKLWADFRSRSGFLFLVELSMCVMLWAIWQSFQRWIWRPMFLFLTGMMAIERRDFSFRLETEESAEWKDLFLTFNTTISEMRDLELAHIVQSDFFPNGRVYGGNWAYLGRNRMARHMGGDYHDAKIGPQGNLTFLIGDIAGHGVEAAIALGIIKAGFDHHVKQGIDSPLAILQGINQLLLRSSSQRIAMTCLIGTIEPNGAARLCNAGHCFPLILSRKLRQVTTLELVGDPLGVTEKTRLSAESHVVFGSDNQLILHSHGCTELKKSDGEQFGRSRLDEVLIATSDLEPEAVAEALFTSLAYQTGKDSWDEDVTIAFIWNAQTESPTQV